MEKAEVKDLNTADKERLDCEYEITPNIIIPFERDKEYYVESLGVIERKPVYDFFKRVFDIVMSALGLIILFLPMLIIAIMIRFSTKGKVLFFQERLGHNGKTINIIKFTRGENYGRN